MTTDTPDPKRIRRITESLLGLPTLPTVVSKMIELVDNPKTSAASLARLISADQSMTARILKLANSAYYGFSREISTVNMAIIVMGFNAVKDMGLSLSVFNIFGNSMSVKNFDVAQFWEHSIGCGLAAKLMAGRYHHSKMGEAFVAGLLHDIGKIILDQYFHKEFEEIMGRAGNGADLDAAEMAVVGTGHGEIGGWLADKWRLPLVISESIRLHHQPLDAVNDPGLVAIVHIANFLCHTCNLGSSGRINPLPPAPEVWNALHRAGIAIDESELENLKMELLLEFDKNNTFLSFIHTEDEEIDAE
jgi:putative nucleotidyltransferase with HDIG domain